MIQQPAQSVFAGEFHRRSHGEVRIKLPSSEAQNRVRTIVFTPPEKRATYHPPSAADFLSLAWKTEAQGFEVEGLLSGDPPVLIVPGAVCRWGWKWLRIMDAVFGPRAVNPAVHSHWETQEVPRDSPSSSPIPPAAKGNGCPGCL